MAETGRDTPRMVVGRPHLLRSGHDDEDIRGQVRNGDLARITRGWYRTAPPADEQQDVIDRVIAHLMRAPGLVASHESAAVMHQLPLVFAKLTPIHLTCNSVTGGRRNRERVVHSSPLGASDVTRIAGHRVTSIARTLVDLGCASPDPRTVIAAADAALERKLVEPAAVGVALTAVGHRAGIARARFLLRFADGRSESAGESILRWLFAQVGLPEPAVQVEVRSARGTFLGRVDFAYPECGLVIEFDGYVKYQALLRPGEDVTRAVVREKEREDKRREAGLLVIRVVWADFA